MSLELIIRKDPTRFNTVRNNRLPNKGKVEGATLPINESNVVLVPYEGPRCTWYSALTVCLKLPLARRASTRTFTSSLYNVLVQYSVGSCTLS